jgi:hypothetical protein
MTSPAGEPQMVATIGRELRTPRAAGIAGLAFSVLFVVSIVLLRDHPGAGSSAEEIELFYVKENAGRVALVGLYLVPFAGIAFLWFIAVIRNWLGEREDRFFSTVFFGSGLLFVALLFVAAGAAGALLAGVKFRDQPVPTPDTVVFARSLGFAFLYVYAMRAAAVFIVTVSTIGLRAGGFPRWLALSGYAIGLALLFIPVHIEWIVLLFPAWVAAVSVVILRADGRQALPAAGA